MADQFDEYGFFGENNPPLTATEKALASQLRVANEGLTAAYQAGAFDGRKAAEAQRDALAEQLAEAERQLADGSFYQEKDIDALTTRAETAERQRDEAMAALEFYADRKTWCETSKSNVFTEADLDQGCFAIQILATIKETRDDA